MGLRSWLTPVYSESDYQKVIEFAEYFNYGVNYVIQITKRGNHTWELGDVLIAWSGDGYSSIHGLKPSYCRKNTILLDDFLDFFPG